MLTGPVTAISRGRGRLGADFTYAAVRATALGVATAAFMATGATALTMLVGALCAAQVVAALGFLVAAHRWLWGSWRGLLAPVLGPSAASWALAAVLRIGLLNSLPLAGDRGAALWTLAAAGLLWLPLAAALLGAWLLQPGEAQALAGRVLRPLNWRTA
jgi:hypothetical protein